MSLAPESETALREEMSELTVIPVPDPAEELPAIEPDAKASLRIRLTTLAAVLIPFAAAAGAPFLVWGWGFGWTDFCLLLGMYFLTALGVTVGFHRLFVHGAFETYAWVKMVLAILGSMAVQGSLFQWAGQHRLHHQHSDTPEDPHTPHHHGHGATGVLKGFWHSHVGWLFRSNPPGLERYIKDLRASATLRIASMLFPVWAVLGLVIPAAIGGLITLSWTGVVTGFVWGGLVRVFLGHHVTWSVNSVCHLWGAQPFNSGDLSRDNVLVGILGLGEGWHNAHHAFPTSARHGLAWWQIDVSYWAIRALALVGLAWNLKLPSPEAIAKRRRMA